MEKLYKMFPKEQEDFWKKVFERQERMEEVRLRAGKPVLIRCDGREFVPGRAGEFWEAGRGEDICGRAGVRCFSQEELKTLLLHLCRYSLYAYEEELREGYLTLEGGHRLGVAGQVVMEGDRIRTIKYISFLNLRIAHQIFGAADGLISRIYAEGRVRNTLIVSPPGCGKTTLLRDLVRRISDGNCYGSGKTVGVVDERSEIAGSYLGEAQNDLGVRTDVMDGCPKALGMLLMIRSMAPQVLAVDEIGRAEDTEAIRRALTCGISVIATVHGRDCGDVQRRGLGELFEWFVFLERRDGIPCVRECLERGRFYDEARRRGHGVSGMPGNGAAVYFTPKYLYQKAGGTPGDAGAHGGGDPVQQNLAAGVFSRGGE